MTDSSLLGTDLRVVLGPPGMAVDDARALDVRSRPTPVQRAQRARFGQPAMPEAGAETGPQGWQPEPVGAAELFDLDTISGQHNVAQALILRLLTPKGALAELGHASYGSRLGELIGHGKTEELRGLCRAYILEAIREEPRVENKPLAIDFDPAREQSSSFVVEIMVQPVSSGEPVTVGVEVGL